MSNFLSRKCCKNAVLINKLLIVYVLTEICQQRSKSLGPLAQKEVIISMIIVDFFFRVWEVNVATQRIEWANWDPSPFSHDTTLGIFCGQVSKLPSIL